MTKSAADHDDQDGNHVSNFFSNQLQDGFHEIFTFRGHRLQLRGLKVVEWAEDNRRQSGFYYRQHFLSWDVKQVLLWRQDFLDSQNEPQPHPVLIHQVRFSNQQNFICAIVHIPRLKVFLAAALDMSFKIFDKTLIQLESIRHDERAILELEYDASKDIIFTSGATGISAWKLYRNSSLDKAHVMEKLYSFKGCTDWVTKMIYEPQFNRIYALKERSAQVLSIPRRSCVTSLEDCHEAPINVVCWYERNQFYITGCSRGEIKCWTSNYNHSGLKRAGSPSRGATAGPVGDGSSKVFALLHTFTGHSKAVTGIRLHPISGLAISTGMDGFVKVLNLEALNELFSIKLDAGILSMNVIKMGHHGYGCLMSLADASIKLWKITSVCDFFATSSSKICFMESFENLEAELEHFYQLKHQVDDPNQTIGDAAQAAVGDQGAVSDAADGLKEVNDGEENREEVDGEQPTDGPQAAIEDNEEQEESQEESNQTSGGGVNDRIICTFSSQDLRCFTHKGALLGRLEPEHIVDGIKAFTVSVYQKLLFCLCERDRVRVHCLRRFTFPVVFEFSLQGGKATVAKDVAVPNGVNNNATEPPSPSKKDEINASHQMKEDMGMCCTLVDMAPSNATKIPKGDGSSTVVVSHQGGFGQATGGATDTNNMDYSYKQDARGGNVPNYIESYLLIGLSTGNILFLDTLNNFEVQMSFQANNGAIREMRYRRRLRELIVLGTDYSESYSTIKIFRMPDLELIAEVSELKHVTSFNISLSLSYFAVGTATGTVRLFAMEGQDKQVKEIGRLSENHDAEVVSLTFCDDIRVLCSASLDSKVKFWDLGKRLVRTIQLNLPTCGVLQNGGPGDVLMAQNHYLLTIPLRIWDEGDQLAEMKKQVDALAEQHALAGTSADGRPLIAPSQSSDSQIVPPASKPRFTMRSLLQVVDQAVATKPKSDEQPVVEDDNASQNTASSKKGTRRNSKRTVRLNDDTAVAGTTISGSNNGANDTSNRRIDRRKTSLQLFHEAKATLSQNVDNAALAAAELEEKIFLPDLQGRQFEYVHEESRSRSPSPQFRNDDHPQSFEEDLPSLATDSVYSRFAHFNKSNSTYSAADYPAANNSRRQSEPFVFDTLHPRFLVHKKPAARSVQLEDLGENFSSYLTKLNAVKSMESQKLDLLNKYKDASKAPATFAADSSSVAAAIPRRPAQFGLSPRARLTLLNSHPTQIAATAHGDSDALIEAMTGVLSSTHLARTQEKVICNAAIGMKVSENYRKHRQSVNEARQQRSIEHYKRASVSLSERDKQTMLATLRTKAMASSPKKLVEEVQGFGSEDESTLTPLASETPSLMSPGSNTKSRKTAVAFADEIDDDEAKPAVASPVSTTGAPVPAPPRRRKPLKPT